MGKRDLSPRRLKPRKVTKVEQKDQGNSPGPSSTNIGLMVGVIGLKTGSEFDRKMGTSTFQDGKIKNETQYLRNTFRINKDDTTDEAAEEKVDRTDMSEDQECPILK